MRKLSEIADDLKTLLSSKFGAVVVTTAQIDNQLQQELRSFGKHAFPAVIIAIGQGDYTNENTLREINIALVLVDSFCPGASERSAALLESLETMIALFNEGMELNGVFYIPTDFYPASADATYVCYALTLKAKQGT